MRIHNAFVVLALVVASACKREGTTEQAVTELKASTEAAVYMEKGEVKPLTLVTNAPRNNDVVWTTSSPSVATVSNTGVVTAKTPGSSEVCATTTGYGQTKKTCTHVDVVSTLTVAVAPTTLQLVVGDSGVIATVVAGGMPTAPRTVTLTSRNVAIATVSSSGYVRGVAPGSVVIEARSNFDSTKIAQVTVTVVAKQGPPAAPIVITLNPTTHTFVVGDSLTPSVNITGLPVGADATLLWSSSSPGTATVVSGKIKAVAVGTATITARLASDTSKKATVAITVNAKPTIPPTTPVVTGITTVPAITTLNLAFGKDTTLVVQVTGAQGANLGYTCSSTNVALVRVFPPCRVELAVGFPTVPFNLPKIRIQSIGLGANGQPVFIEIPVNQLR